MTLRALAGRLDNLRYRQVAILLALAALALSLFHGAAMRDPNVHAGDSPAYLAGAYHLAHGNVFSEAVSSEAGPGIGREPGYAFLLSLLMRLDPDGLGKAAPHCVAVQSGCGPIYRTAQRVNVALFVLAAACVATTLALLPGSTPLAALIGGLYVLFNGQATKWLPYLLSDALALFLVALAGLLFAAALRSRRLIAWLLPGLSLGALILTKAIFLPFVVLAVLAGLIAGAVRRSRWVLVASLIVAVASGTMIGGWIARNAAIVGHPALSDERSGIALSTRWALMDLSPRQYATALVYWTRGIGDQIALRAFGEEEVAPLRFETPGGFYDIGQNGYDPRVAAAIAAGKSRRDAVRQVDREIIGAILAAPGAYAATMIPVFYRGIWIDEFILFGLPCLIWLSVRALRRRQWPLLLLLSAGWYNLLAYAALSLNIPRYQMTALPALACASAIVVAHLVNGQATSGRGDRTARRVAPIPPARKLSSRVAVP